ncbi:MAG: methyltransferase domain-containing protein [Lacunisphaera sp.]
MANLQTNLSGLASLTDSLDARLADTADQLRTANQADLAASQVAQATDQRLASIQTALAALQQQAARQESQSTLLAEQLAALKAGQDSALAQLTQAQADAQQQAQSAVNTLRADLEQHLAAVEVRHQAEIARLVQTQAESFQQLSTRQDPIAARLRSDLEQHLAAVEARHQAEIAQIARTQAESFQQLSTRPDPTAARLRSDLEQHLAAVEVRHQAEIAQVARTQAELTQQIQLRAGTSPSAHELAELRNELTELRSELTILHQNHRGFLDRWETAVAKSVKSLPARRSNSGLPDKTSQHLAREKQREFDALYLAFENRFRGSREMIKERLKVNLEILARTSSRALSAPGARWPNRPDAPSYTIVDLGCGRGEWLEVVAQQGQRALGVDLNTYFIAECREHGLAIAESDAITFLRSLPNSCLALVTGFHIIEHLPLPLLLELISETHRVLVKGGTALFETPNCKNLTVGAANFYCDPTHQHPVFPETAQFLLKYAGFTEAKIDYRLPASGSPFDQSKPDQSALHGWFYGPQDYAVIAIK